jgi:endonuclease/exonuclease/phosphatase family metal-dependent hydrolase
MLQLVTWNIYCGPVKNENQQWDSLEWPARRSAVTTEICLCHGMQSAPTIFCYQEVMHDQSLVDLTALAAKSHHLFYVQTSPRNMGILTAIPNYFTDIKVLDDSMIERPAGWYPGYSIISCKHAGKTIIVVNTHASTKQSAREMICKSLAKEIRRLRNEKAADIFLWAGDFNAFPDAGGVELFYELQQLAGMTDATSVIVSPHNPAKRVLTTFKAYPDDAFMPTGPLLAYHLDHILVSGDCTYGPPTCDNSTDGSDHYPVKLLLKFNQEV